MSSVRAIRIRFSHVREAIDAKAASSLVFLNELETKFFIVAAGGDLEKRTIDAILHLYRSSNIRPHLIDFVNRKALKRQFHTLFNWDQDNANSFFGLFGEEKRSEMKEICREEPYKTQVSSFLRINRLRNEIVHEGMANYSVPVTIDEAEKLYEQAMQVPSLIVVSL